MLRAPMHPEGKVLFISGGIANSINVSPEFFKQNGNNSYEF